MSQAKPRGKIVAAIAFDSQTNAIVRCVSSLARRYLMDVHFIMVVEPSLQNPWAAVGTDGSTILSLYTNADKSRRQDGMKRMEQLAEQIELPFRAKTSVVYGHKIPSLIDESVAQSANLLVTGFNTESYRLRMSGLSTALSLLSEAPLPVLAVSEGQCPDFSKLSFKTMIADDYREDTREAVRKGFELAAANGSGEVRQLYVHGNFCDLIRSRWDELKGRLSLQDIGTLDPETVWENEYQDLIEKGKLQGAPFRLKAEQAGVKTTLDVRTGSNFADEFRDALSEFSPDLLIFGRHRTTHSRPFLIGRMPFRSMLELQKPILMVPPAGELYARLPFPVAS